MDNKTDEPQTARQQDADFFRGYRAIFSEGDLRELINCVYSGYQYRSSVFDKLAKLIDFLSPESLDCISRELADENRKLSDYLDNFSDFLKSNFHPGEHTADGDMLYLFNTEETCAATEAFLAEFQLLALDAEKAYRQYLAAVACILQ